MAEDAVELLYAYVHHNNDLHVACRSHRIVALGPISNFKSERPAVAISMSTTFHFHLVFTVYRSTNAARSSRFGKSLEHFISH